MPCHSCIRHVRKYIDNIIIFNTFENGVIIVSFLCYSFFRAKMYNENN